MTEIVHKNNKQSANNTKAKVLKLLYLFFVVALLCFTLFFVVVAAFWLLRLLPLCLKRGLLNKRGHNERFSECSSSSSSHCHIQEIRNNNDKSKGDRHAAKNRKSSVPCECVLNDWTEFYGRNPLYFGSVFGGVVSGKMVRWNFG